MFSGKNILITGCNGFIGRHLAEHLHKYKCSVYGIDLVGSKPKPDFIYYECDITSYEQLRDVYSQIKPDYIFHLAALVSAERDFSRYPEMYKIHVNSLYNIYKCSDQIAEIELLVNFGSTEEYGDYDGLPFEETFFEKSLSPYAATKTAGAHLAFMLGKQIKFPVITIRPSVLFGDFQPDNKFMSYILRKILSEQEVLVSGCEQSRDFIYVKRFLQILFDLIESRKLDYGEIYNIASGKSYKLREVIDFAKDKLNSNSETLYGRYEYRENEIMKFNVSIEKVRKILGCDYQFDYFLSDFSSYLTQKLEGVGK